MARGARKCSYDTCQLPDNNNRYWWQFVYLILGVICLIAKEDEFTFFPLFTFVAPVLIDLLGSEVNHGLASKIRLFFIVINVILVLMCLVGWYGLIQDTGSFFVISEEAMVFAGLKMKKQVFLPAIVANIFVPVLYSQVSPCKARAAVPEMFQTYKKEGVQCK